MLLLGAPATFVSRPTYDSWSVLETSQKAKQEVLSYPCAIAEDDKAF